MGRSIRALGWKSRKLQKVETARTLKGKRGNIQEKLAEMTKKYSNEYFIYFDDPFEAAVSRC